MQVPSTGNIFTPKSEPLSDILPNIQKHRTALPNFQRPWVWEPFMVKDLIVSVAYRFPAGSLLTMPVKTETFALRPFAGSGETLVDSPSIMVLDGQQRLTSLYQALFSARGVAAPDGRTYYFYLDVEHLMTDPDGSIDEGEPLFEDSLFFVQVDRNGQRVRYEGLKTKYDVATRDLELEHGALPLNLLFTQDGLRDGVTITSVRVRT